MRINSGHTNVDEVILPCTGTVWAPEIILCDPPHVSPLQMIGIDSSTTDYLESYAEYGKVTEEKVLVSLNHCGVI